MKHLLGELIEIGDNKYVVTRVWEVPEENSLPRAKVEMWKLPNQQKPKDVIQRTTHFRVTTSDEIKQIIDNTTKKPKLSDKYEIYLPSKGTKSFILTYNQQFVERLSKLLNVKRTEIANRIDKEWLAKTETFTEADKLRAQIRNIWEADYLLDIEIREIGEKNHKPKKTAIKDATFGLYLTCHNEPQFIEAYKKQFLELIKQYDDTVIKNLESGLISTHQSVLILELTRDYLIKDWNLDYMLTFEIKKIQNGNC